MVTSSTPLTGAEVLLRLVAIALLIAINAFFVTAEFSIVSVRRSRINQLVDAGDIQARTVQDLQQSIERLLSTTQLGITLSSLALGWIGEGALVTLVEEGINVLPLQAGHPEAIAHSLAIPGTFLILAYVQIVLGELCPKSVALIYAEQLSRVLGAPSLAIARLFNPFIWVLNQSTRLLLRLLGIRSRQEDWYDQVTPEELQRIIATSSESTGLEEEERQRLRSVFEFGEVTAGEVMIPRTNVVALPITATVKQLLEEIAKDRYSRYPVIGESLDDIRGIVDFKELAEPLVVGRLTLDSPIQAWVRPARFVQETVQLDELLQLMQRSQQPMMIVVDEFGGTAGLVTIHDLTAEILGTTTETSSHEERSIQILDDQMFLVQAHIDLEAVNDLLGLNLPLTDDYQTLAGFMIYYLQKIPQTGEILCYGPWEFMATAIEGPRLLQIRIRRLEPENAPESESFDNPALAQEAPSSPTYPGEIRNGETLLSETLPSETLSGESNPRSINPEADSTPSLPDLPHPN
jgi:CBS domain containing-hemolysin-like protein